MFSKKEYFEVNREERHFGNLLISSIIYDDVFRNSFFGLIDKKLDKCNFLNKEFDIYSETAIIRDYWYDLGDYKEITHDRLNISRRNIINTFLEYFNIDIKIIDEYDVFWTNHINNSYLWFPGNWTTKKNIGIIKKIQKKHSILDEKLCRIGWACNAKPDILIISNNNCLIIELKLESGEGKNDSGYNQFQTQYDIIELSKKTIPCFAESNFERIIISKENTEKNISWNEIIDFFNNSLVKKHFARIEMG